MSKLIKPFMSLHRFIQLIGLYGVLFLIPILQHQINTYSGAEDDYKTKRIQYVVEHLYYDVKQLVCRQLGQAASSHDCKKGIYQDPRLKSAVGQEQEVANKKKSTLAWYWIVYYVFAVFGFVGTYIEYRKEYVNSKS